MQRENQSSLSFQSWDKFNAAWNGDVLSLENVNRKCLGYLLTFYDVAGQTKLKNVADQTAALSNLNVTRTSMDELKLKIEDKYRELTGKEYNMNDAALNSSFADSSLADTLLADTNASNNASILDALFNDLGMI